LNHLYKLKYIVLIIGISFPSEKSSKDIQSDINSRNNELRLIKEEIKEVENNIIKETKNAISASKLLLKLDEKINLTKKLMTTISKEINSTNEKIYMKERTIDSTNSKIMEIRRELKSRLIHLYKKGKPSIIESLLLSKDWNDAIYKTKYLDVLSSHEKQLEVDLNIIINELEIQKDQLKRDIAYKKQLKRNKETEKLSLKKDKNKREKLLVDINNRKKQYEQDLIRKQKNMSKIETIIKDLLKDQSRVKERELELARIRELQNMNTRGNFIKMKGKLPWPVDGKLISKFGLIKNKELNTTTENIGIEIKSDKKTKVTSVSDGVVTEISYVKGYIVIILHGDGFRTVYWGMKKINVEENDYVQLGMPIGEMTNNEILQFQVWNKDKKENPERWLSKR